MPAGWGENPGADFIPINGLHIIERAVVILSEAKNLCIAENARVQRFFPGN